jgi:4-aminobutyrate aminotransferase-like enzyme
LRRAPLTQLPNAEAYRPKFGQDARINRRALTVCAGALRRGVLVLTEGEHGNVIAFTPPLVITEEQLDTAVDIIEDELARASAAAT